jgi:leader peptidase (prepilin peptidase)/N-methyltransferase
MNATSVAGWGLVGFIIGGCLRELLQQTSLLPTTMRRLAPPVVLETVTAVLFAALAWRIGAVPDLFAYSWLAATSVPLAAIDWNFRVLPTKLIWSSGVMLAALFGVAAAVDRDVCPLARSFAAMVVLLAFYGTLYFLLPGQLGGGDLRLAGVLGLALGWASWTAVLAGTLLGWLAAAITVFVLHIVRRTQRGRAVPLGPFLIIGAFMTLLAGSTI